MGQHYLSASLGLASFSALPDPAAEIISFWRHSSRFWFEKNPGFDAYFGTHFSELHDQVMSGEHKSWLADPYAALALLLMTDQYPRFAFRGTVGMYSGDALAIQFARLCLKTGYPYQVEERLRLFFFLPFCHSEDLDDHRISVEFTSLLGNPWSKQAIDHMEIIRRFGRFPHRNEMLGRASTQEEVTFLQNGPDPSTMTT
ncbi:MAG: DUF924 family protein [Rhizobiaceae bacterium]|nr:DUF924 family protein [Rhizobiaceae bacterium]